MAKTKRRQFLEKLAIGIGGFSGFPFLLQGKNRLEEVSSPHQAQAKDALDSIKITDIRFYTLQFPKETPLTWNVIKESGGKKPKVTFMEIETDAGIKGVVIPKWPSELVRKFAKKIKGLNLLHVEKVWHHMYHHNRKPVAKGVELHAIGSVDLTVWDIVGKALQLPVHRALGTYREDIPAYAAAGYYAKDKGIKELVTEMESYAKEGFQLFKPNIQ